MVSADYLPSRVHGQFTATMADEVRHGAKCPCRAAPLDGLREAARLVVDRFLDTPAALAGVHVAALAALRAALRDEGETT